MKFIHGDCRTGERTAEHRIWYKMIRRCEDRREHSYPNYGGRGIRVCERWRTSYVNFLGDMGRRPSKAHSIDRIDNDGHYEPGNCRWATRVEQRANMRPGLGRGAPGERNSQAKLDAARIRVIRRCCGLGIPDRDVAATFGVSKSTVGYIRRGERWAHVPSGGLFSQEAMA